jgi:hypothetical protein
MTFILVGILIIVSEFILCSIQKLAGHHSELPIHVLLFIGDCAPFTLTDCQGFGSIMVAQVNDIAHPFLTVLLADMASGMIGALAG